MHYQSLSELTQQHKSGKALGIYSVCSANPYVIRAALQQARSDESLLLVEATSNQVDQFGGYTGMRPADFISFVEKFAAEAGFQRDHIVEFHTIPHQLSDKFLLLDFSVHLGILV